MTPGDAAFLVGVGEAVALIGVLWWDDKRGATKRQRQAATLAARQPSHVRVVPYPDSDE